MSDEKTPEVIVVEPPTSTEPAMVATEFDEKTTVATPPPTPEVRRDIKEIIREFDSRPIEKLQLCTALSPTYAEVAARHPERVPTQETIDEWKDAHAVDIAVMLTMLKRCGVSLTGDIDKLGCTGAINFLNLSEIETLRLGLAGSGVGLPCFVPPTRFCLAHQTVGGLQREQAIQHEGNISKVSRPLTPKEAGAVAFTDGIRRMTKGMGEASNALSGFGDLPKGMEIVDESEDFMPPRMEGFLPPADVSLAQSWKCPEHSVLQWSCRYCVAQALVEGALVPAYAVLWDAPGGMEVGTPEEIQRRIDQLDQTGVPCVDIYVHLKRLERKLA